MYLRTLEDLIRATADRRYSVRGGFTAVQTAFYASFLLAEGRSQYKASLEVRNTGPMVYYCFKPRLYG
jgi:hypothetical protein